MSAKDACGLVVDEVRPLDAAGRCRRVFQLLKTCLLMFLLSSPRVGESLIIHLFHCAYFCPSCIVHNSAVERRCLRLSGFLQTFKKHSKSLLFTSAF